jgi:hypothetical protein
MEYNEGTQFPDSEQPYRYFNGYVDEVMVHERALSEDEIDDLYALTSTAKGELYAMLPARAGLDLVSRSTANSCGIQATDWSYERQPEQAPLKLPYGGSAEIKWATQPNYDGWWTNHDHICPFTCYDNYEDSQTIFRFADRVQSTNFSTGDDLYGSVVVTPPSNSTTTYTFAAGGYKPEDGYGGSGFSGGRNQSIESGDDEDQVGMLYRNWPPLYDFWQNASADGPTGQEHWYYNATSSDYYHPSISVTVVTCAVGEIVVNNLCTPCAPGELVAGNTCVGEAPPTLTIQTLVDGVPSDTVPLGQTVTVRATYTAGMGDTITDAEINGGLYDSNTAACTGSPGSCPTPEYNVDNTYATADFLFTPTELDTYEFYPVVKTANFFSWNNYANVVEDVTAVCPANSTENNGECVCNEGYVDNGLGQCVLDAPPLSTLDTFNATRVRKGNSSTLSWSIAGMAPGLTCSITPSVGDITALWDGAENPWTGTIATPPINVATRYTLSCTNGVDAVSKSTTAGILPVFQEI